MESRAWDIARRARRFYEALRPGLVEREEALSHEHAGSGRRPLPVGERRLNEGPGDDGTVRSGHNAESFDGKVKADLDRDTRRPPPAAARADKRSAPLRLISRVSRFFVASARNLVEICQPDWR